MLALLLATGLLLAPSKPAPAAAPTPVAIVSSVQSGSGADYILVRQATYGPSAGRYQNLTFTLAQTCGTQSAYCEAYCPKVGFGSGGKGCQIVYACGEHVTKSTRSQSGELIVMDCRPAASQTF